MEQILKHLRDAYHREVEVPDLSIMDPVQPKQVFIPSQLLRKHNQGLLFGILTKRNSFDK